MTTLRLFLRRNHAFFEGMGRIFDFGGTLNKHRVSSTPEYDDYLAIRSDWEALAQDLAVVCQKFEKESNLQELKRERIKSK